MVLIPHRRHELYSTHVDPSSGSIVLYFPKPLVAPPSIVCIFLGLGVQKKVGSWNQKSGQLHAVHAYLRLTCQPDPPPPPSASGDSDAVVQCALLPQSEASRDIAYVTDMPEALQVNLRLGAPERAVSELLTPSRSSKTMMIVDSLHSAQPGTLSSHTSVYLYKYCSTTALLVHLKVEKQVFDDLIWFQCFNMYYSIFNKHFKIKLYLLF